MSRTRLIKVIVALCCLILTSSIKSQTFCPPDPVGLYVTADNLNPLPGETICYSVRVRNFDGVAAFIFTMTFSTETLTFSSINATIGGLPGLDENDFIPPTMRDPDIFRVAWSDNDLQPNFIDDDAVLFEICFEVTGVTGQDLRFELGANGLAGTGSFIQFVRVDDIGDNCDESEMGVTLPENNDVPEVISSDCANGLELASFNRCGSLAGRSDGTIELQIFCGTGPYQINVDANPAINTLDSVFLVTGLRSGPHILRVTDLSDGTSTSPLMINVPETPGLTYDPPQLQQPRCAISGSTPRGRITISNVEGGTPFSDGTYLFDWGASRFGRGDSVLSFLAPATYSLSLSDSLGCTVTDTFVLMAELIEVIPSSSPARCIGVDDGTVSVEASGGINVMGNGYFFFLQGTTEEGMEYNDEIQPNQSSTATFNNVPAGVYMVWAEDDDFPRRSCEPNPQNVIVGTSQNYTTSISFDPDTNCPAGEQSRIISLSRSEEGASFSWQIWRIENGMQALQVSMAQNIDDLDITTGCLPLGDYELVLQDDDGCEFIEPFVIDGCTLVVDSLISPPFCESPGTINLITISGTDPVEFIWSTGDTTSGISDLLTGTYDVTITDAAQCSLQYSFTLVEPNAFTLDIAVQNLSCPTGVTDITVIPSQDGIPPFLYDWSPNPGTESDNQLLGVPSGTYAVTVTDDDGFGCEVVDSVTIPTIMSPSFSLTPAVAPRCQGDNSGVINISIETTPEFPGPFNFIASSGEMGTNPLTFSPANLPSGRQWILYATDQGCVFDTVFFDVPEGPKLEIDTALSSLGSIGCFGDLAIVNLTATGGANISYMWPAPYDVGTGNTKIDVAAGEYIITLTAGTCISEDTILITQPDSFGISIDENLSSLPLCSGDLADLVTSTSGGVMPFNYEWRNENGDLVSSDFDANGLEPGIYMVTATDNNGCTSSDTIEITVNDPVEAFIGEPLQPFCFGDPGQIFVDSVRGGRAPYRYQVDTNPAIDIADTSVVESGDHVISIFDLNGCSTSFDFTIDTPEELSIALQSNNVIELGRSGTISASIESPVPVDTIIWTTLSGDEDVVCTVSDCSTIEVTPINNQTYTATVINVDGCSASASIDIEVIRSQRVYIPNIFSPNSIMDAGNRVFQVFAGSGVEAIDYLRIFDRWGNLVHQEQNLEVRNNGLGSGSWDGTYGATEGGRLLEPGVYVYVIQVRYLGDPDPEIRKGDVTLIR